MSEVPRREEIADFIRRSIAARADGYRPGDTIRTYRQLAQDEKVSETTARGIYRDLVKEGLLTGRQGSGYTVRRPPATRDTERFWYRRGRRSAFKAAQRAAGREPKVTCTSLPEVAPEDVAERLGIPEGAETMRSDLAFFSDGEPTHISTSWEPREITGGTPIELPEDGPHAGWGVVDRMDVIGWRCIRVIEKCRARGATADEAASLKQRPGSPVIEIERTHYATKYGVERAVETATIVGPEGLRMIYEVPVKDPD